MAFFKFRQRGQAQPESRGRAKESAPAGAQETIDSMRRRARHRLLGAAVLVLVAVVGFPIVFDTQPRPVTVDAPITIPDKDKIAPLGAPAGEPVSAKASLDEKEEVIGAAPARGADAKPGTAIVAPAAAPKVAAEAPPATAKPVETARDAKADAGAEQARAADEAAQLKREEAARAKREQDAQAQAKRDLEAQAKREQEARAKREQETQAKRDAETQTKREQEARTRREADERARREEAARAKALLEGRSTTAAAAAADKAATDGGRFIVQVGAFADAAAAREVRQKAERAGLKTYTQVIDTPQGKRTRVRVGPYPSRAEAEQAATALKRAGLSGSILSL
jgi:DedD protein